MKTLHEIYEECRKGGRWPDKATVHSYIEVYEELFSPVRSTAKKVLEIGILGAHSLRMWEEYFANAEVHGVDICERPLDMFDLAPVIAEGTHHISILDATIPEQVERYFGKMKFDVIVEDASHVLAHQLAIYQNFKNKMAEGGIYVIEDIENIDKDSDAFTSIDPAKSVKIMDRRSIKHRFDDVLVIIR